MKPLPDKKHILNSIAVIAKKLGRAPSQAEFVAQSGISKYFVLRSFSSWTEAVRAAGLHPSALLKDWGGAVRRNGGVLPRHMFRRAAKYNPCTLAKRFGGWLSVPRAFSYRVDKTPETGSASFAVWQTPTPRLNKPVQPIANEAQSCVAKTHEV